MSQNLIELLLLLNRFVHVVCTAVIIGGTLFYELIVPIAIDDLKKEQQLYVFGRARVTFKGVVWTCSILLLLSGLVSTARMWPTYVGGPASRVPIQMIGRDDPVESPLRRPGWWWAGHSALGVMAIVIAIVLTSVRRPPDYPLLWMRILLTVLLVSIFLASTARHVRLLHEESERGGPLPRLRSE